MRDVAFLGELNEEYKKSFKVTKKQYGGQNAKELKKLHKIANLVLQREPTYAAMDNGQLADQTQILKQRLQAGETLDEILLDAYAVCREASWRVLHQKHYYVQILGGIALHQGRICQMATGEGKTLTETLPAYLNALEGKGVHIVTVNDYLACRDADWMGKVFRFLGLSVGVTLSEEAYNTYGDGKGDFWLAKKQAYQCDITYGTNSEFGFDYLRDNMAWDISACVQRTLNFVIIDEVDSILIDEARTPLIISAQGQRADAMYGVANRFVAGLKNSTNVDEEGKVISDDKGEDGEEQQEELVQRRQQWQDKQLTEQDLVFSNADVAGQQFVAEEEEFSSGGKKAMPNGDYVVDKKSRSVRLTDKGIRKAEIAFKVRNLSDPENLDLNHYINNALRAHAIMHKDEDYIVEQGKVIIVDSFTGRKMEGRRFSDGLHQAIEAKENVQVQSEDRTLATITLQNFFRLYHKMSGMTGTAKTEENEFNSIYNIDVVAIPTNKPLVRNDMPDMMFATRRAKLAAIVEEIKARHATGQPLLVGTITVEKSEELHRMLVKENIPHKVLNAKYHQKEAEIVAQAGRFGAVTIATNMAGRGTDILLGGNAEFLARQEMQKLGCTEQEVEQATSFLPAATEQAQQLQAQYNQLLEKFRSNAEQERRQVVQVGGLCVIGTERHEARRIDNQVRGRSGRQGDPGDSLFFVSAEDDMVRIFGRDMLQRAMMFLNSDENTPIQSKLLSSVIQSAQKRLEGMHFSARKSVLQYDDVNNRQRKVIYAQRRKILEGQDSNHILQMTDDYARILLERACKGQKDVFKWNLRNVNAELYNGYLPRPDLIAGQQDFQQVQQTLEDYCNFVLEEDQKFADDPQQSPYYGFVAHMLKVYNIRLHNVFASQAKSRKDVNKFVPVKKVNRQDLVQTYVSVALQFLKENYSKYTENWDMAQANAHLVRFFPPEPLLTEKNVTSFQDVQNLLQQICRDKLKQTQQKVQQMAGDEQLAEQRLQQLQREMLLQNLDSLWMNHIDALDDLRQGIGLQAIGQHDPLQMYQREAYDMFVTLQEEITLRTMRELLFNLPRLVVQSRRTKAAEPKKPLQREEKPLTEEQLSRQQKQEQYRQKREDRKKQKQGKR